MLLPVITPCKYISPSSFMEWRSCPYKFYISRLAGFPYIVNGQSRSAAIGSIFDAYAKANLAEKYGVDKPTLKFKQLLASNVTFKGDDLSDILLLGKEIWEWYSRYVSFDPEAIDFEVDLFKIIDGVPLFGKLDAISNLYPFDWKLTQGQLTPGYFVRSDTGEYHVDKTLFLEDSNVYWAIQMLFYNWLMGYGHHGSQDFRCTIHQIKCNEKKKQFVLAEHSRNISQKFTNQIWKEVQEMWNNINRLECEIPEPRPHRRVCENFNQLCKVAFRCNAYKRTLADEDRRAHYV